MAGFGSPLLPLGLASPPTTTESGYRSLLAFWAGGAANSGTTPEPEPEQPRPITAGNLDDRRYRYRWAQGYLKRKRELFGSLESDEVREEVQTLLEQREQAAEEASAALEQGQNIFLRMAIDAIAGIERRLSELGIEAPAFDTKELDVIYVLFMVLAADE